jgi:hypothetical protein
MFEFNPKTGVMTQNGEPLENGDKCYSGTGDGRNNPSMEDVPNVGPIPRGRYRIGMAYDDAHLGPCVMHLDPLPGTNDFNRSAFRIHGNNASNDASHGCVICGPAMRALINASRDRVLLVTSGGNNETDR